MKESVCRSCPSPYWGLFETGFRRTEKGAECEAERARQPQTRGRCGGNEAVECRHAKVVEGIEGAPEGVIIEMAGLNAWGNEARDGLILEKMGHEVELLVDKPQTVEHHGFDRMAGGYNPHFRVLLGGQQFPPMALLSYTTLASGQSAGRFDFNLALMSIPQRPKLSASQAEYLPQVSSGHTTPMTPGKRRMICLRSQRGEQGLRGIRQDH